MKTETIYTKESARGDCYFWRHTVEKTEKSIIISDYTNVQGNSDCRAFYKRNPDFDAAISAWIETLKADFSAWQEWSNLPLRDYYTGEKISFFGVIPYKIEEREVE